MVPIEMSTPHSYSTSIHTIGLSCIVWPQYTTQQTTDRQSDRNRPPMLWHRRFLKVAIYVKRRRRQVHMSPRFGGPGRTFNVQWLTQQQLKHLNQPFQKCKRFIQNRLSSSPVRPKGDEFTRASSAAYIDGFFPKLPQKLGQTQICTYHTRGHLFNVGLQNSRFCQPPTRSNLSTILFPHDLPLCVGPITK